MNKIAYLFLIVLIVLYIYIVTKDEKIYYLSIGDDITIGRTIDNDVESISNIITKYLKEKGVYEKSIDYSSIGYRTTDLLNDINNNIKLEKDITIKNAIIKADFITISIGLNDFFNYLNDYQLLKDNLISLKYDMKELLESLRKISKEKIILIGIYNPNQEDNRINNVIMEINKIYKLLAQEYNIYYLDIYEDIKPHIKDTFPTKEGYELIVTKLIRYVESDIIN